MAVFSKKKQCFSGSVKELEKIECELSVPNNSIACLKKKKSKSITVWIKKWEKEWDKIATLNKGGLSVAQSVKPPTSGQVMISGC